jgi:hypothetical protein
MFSLWHRACAAAPRVPLALALIGAVALAGCDQPPTAGAPKTLANVCDRENDGKRVALDGYLSLPSSYTESASSQSAPVVIRGALAQSGDVTFVWIPYGSGPNAMEKVPDEYSQTDLKVYATDGGAIGYKDHVRVSGTVAFPSQRPYDIDSAGGKLLDCGLNNPLIEKI